MKKIFLSLLAIAATGSLMAGVTPHYEIEAGYDHGIARLRYDVTSSFFSNSAQMDGFHAGGKVQMDFSDGQHKPGLAVGLNYQFLAQNLMEHSPEYKALYEQAKSAMEALGAKNIRWTYYAYMHTIQVPIRVQYTYQANNDWRLFAYTGPQVRFHVALTEDKMKTSTLNGTKSDSYTSQNYVNGTYSAKTWENGKLTDAYQFETQKDPRMNWFDMSWGFGLGFGWQWLSVSFTYDLGMINLFDNDYAKEHQLWRLNSDALAVTLGFRLK